MFIVCFSLVFGIKNVQFHIIFSLQHSIPQHSISINILKVDPYPDSVHNGVVKPNQRVYKAIKFIVMSV